MKPEAIKTSTTCPSSKPTKKEFNLIGNSLDAENSLCHIHRSHCFGQLTRGPLLFHAILLELMMSEALRITEDSTQLSNR